MDPFCVSKNHVLWTFEHGNLEPRTAMSFRRSKVKLALCFVILMTVVLVLWRPVRQTWALAAVEDALKGKMVVRQAEGLTRFGGYAETQVKAFLDSRGVDAEKSARYAKRANAFFGGPVEQIEIVIEGRGRGEQLGAALARVPNLRHVSIKQAQPYSCTEADMKQLCQHLRTMPELETLTLEGSKVTNDSIAPLGSHPRLRVITIRYAHITPRSIATFGSMSALERLELGDAKSSVPWPALRDVRVMSKALPSLPITSRWNVQP